MRDTYPLAPLLTLRDFGVRAGHRVLLEGLDITVPHRGVVALMGPGGAGKSTLVRSICGLLAADRKIKCRGTARYLGRLLGSRGYPVLVRQKADLLLGTTFDCLSGPLDAEASFDSKRLRVEVMLRCLGCTQLLDLLPSPMISLDAVSRRIALLIRGVMSNPRLLCVDEPTANLSDGPAEQVLDLLARVARNRAVLFVTHNQMHARRIANSVALLNDRRLVAQLPLDEFFDSDIELVQTFVRTGGLPSGNGGPFVWDDVSESTLHPFVSELHGPSGFRWLESGRLAGVPMPGVVNEVRNDLSMLRSVGVSVVVSLNDEAPIDAIRDGGFESLFHPFPDMRPPTVHQAFEICEAIGARVDRGNVVAVHCKAGLGRTGTVLACYLIYRGASSSLTLRHIRSIDAGWVQSPEQENFLKEFEQWLDQRSKPDPTSI